jgi:hypothetical protein
MKGRLPFWGALAALFCVGVIAAFGGSSGSAAAKAGTPTNLTVTLTAETTTAEEPTLPQTTVQVTVTNTQTTVGPGTVVVNPPASTTDTSSETKT